MSNILISSDKSRVLCLECYNIASDQMMLLFSLVFIAQAWVDFLASMVLFRSQEVRAAAGVIDRVETHVLTIDKCLAVFAHTL